MTVKTNPMLSPQELLEGTQTEEQQEIEFTPFYDLIDTKDGRRIRVNYVKFINLLRKMGFRRYDLGPEKIMVKDIDNVVEQVTVDDIIDEVERYIMQFPENLPDGVLRDKLLNKVYSGLTTYFSNSILKRLTDDRPTVFRSHTQHEAYFYYKNGFTKITADGVELLPYSQLNGKIWKNQILDREFKVLDEKEWGRAHFCKFMKNISNNWSKRPDGVTNTPDEERYKIFRTIIGYLLHAYFEGDMKAVIFTDSRLSDDPDGRTGKTLIFQALGKVLNRNKLSKTFVEISGKAFELKDKFRYQQLGIDTVLINLNDIQRNFPIEELFNDITEGVKREKKTETPIHVRTKIGICTNLTIRIHGGSALDRCLEFELADYYSHKIKPAKEFGHWFFRDWSKEEWCRFDNLMLSCVSDYLSKGLLKPSPINLLLRKLQEETCPEFVVWMNEKEIHHEEELDKKKTLEEFLSQHETSGFDKWLKQRVFTSWLQLYADYHPDYSGRKERRSNNRDFIMYMKKDWQ